MNVVNVDEEKVLSNRPRPPNATAPAAASSAAAKKPGGDSAAVAAQPVTALDAGSLLGELIATTCNKLIAPKRGDHWNINEQETAMIGQAYGAVLAKYFPTANFGVEVTAIVVTGLVFGPRIATDRKNKKADGKKQSSDVPTNVGSQDAIPGRAPSTKNQGKQQ